MKRMPVAWIFSVLMLASGSTLANCNGYLVGGGGTVHGNGGGWVVTGARIADSVYVGPQSAICGDRTVISGNVRIIDSMVANAVISGNVIVRGSVVSGFGRITSNARIIDSQVNDF